MSLKENYISIYASSEYCKRVYLPLLLIIPIYIYGVLTTVNDLTGWDLTGGLMGQRNPVTAGYVVLFGSPMYLWYTWKAARAYFVKRPEYIRVSHESVLILLPRRLVEFKKSETEFEIYKSGEHNYLNRKSGSSVTQVRLSDLNITNQSLISIFLKFGYTVTERT